MIYCFDIDGTLCSNTNGDYEQAVPQRDVIDRLNELYDSGHRIILFTARGSTTGRDWRKLTEAQMESWSVSFHELVMGKPEADVYIDDKGIDVLSWMRGAAGPPSKV